jgi:hypothetical protein
MHLVHEGDPLLVFRGGFPWKFGNIDAGGKSPTGAFDDDYPHLVVLIQQPQAVIKLPGQLAAESIHFVGPVQGQGADLVLVFHSDSSEIHGKLLGIISFLFDLINLFATFKQLALV